ncbi:disulfide bond formation protein B [Candidatus Liberibacter americanus]|nr:disulfide bond formation protein B [Candidatus Liberibacter americanus]
MSSISKLTNLHIIRILIVGFTVVLICSLALQHIAGYIPCKLCLQERSLHFYCLLIAIIASFTAYNNRLYLITCILMGLVSIIMIYNIVLGIIHVEIELNILSAANACIIKPMNEEISAEDLSSSIENQAIVPCNKVNLNILGLSPATWNIIYSVIFSIISYVAAIKTFRKSYPHK